MLHKINKKLPFWLKKRIPLGMGKMECLLNELNLNTVCLSAHCPNRGECFAKGEVTFMILGNICTRNCKFCAVKKGHPLPPDPQEPAHIAAAAEKLNLDYVVITSVTRDDLPDGGASQFIKAIRVLRNLNRRIKVEILIPDFKADRQIIRRVVEAGPDVLSHNLETVPRLYPEVRPKANYHLSLKVLEWAKKFNKEMYVKSGLMLGLGEKEEEVLALMEDLRTDEVDFLTLGQYLRPSEEQLAVKEFLPPEKFAWYKEEARKRGFLNVASAPFVRSSYQAAQLIPHLCDV